MNNGRSLLQYPQQISKFICQCNIWALLQICKIIKKNNSNILCKANNYCDYPWNQTAPRHARRDAAITGRTRCASKCAACAAPSAIACHLAPAKTPAMSAPATTKCETLTIIDQSALELDYIYGMHWLLLLSNEDNFELLCNGISIINEFLDIFSLFFFWYVRGLLELIIMFYGTS